jgi:hypothetical protein
VAAFNADTPENKDMAEKQIIDLIIKKFYETSEIPS